MNLIEQNWIWELWKLVACNWLWGSWIVHLQLRAFLWMHSSSLAHLTFSSCNFASCHPFHFNFWWIFILFICNFVVLIISRQRHFSPSSIQLLKNYNSVVKTFVLMWYINGLECFTFLQPLLYATFKCVYTKESFGRGRSFLPSSSSNNSGCSH